MELANAVAILLLIFLSLPMLLLSIVITLTGELKDSKYRKKIKGEGELISSERYVFILRRYAYGIKAVSLDDPDFIIELNLPIQWAKNNGFRNIELKKNKYMYNGEECELWESDNSHIDKAIRVKSVNYNRFAINLLGLCMSLAIICSITGQLAKI